MGASGSPQLVRAIQAFPCLLYRYLTPPTTRRVVAHYPSEGANPSPGSSRCCCCISLCFPAITPYPTLRCWALKTWRSERCCVYAMEHPLCIREGSTPLAAENLRHMQNFLNWSHAPQSSKPAPTSSYGDCPPTLPFTPHPQGSNRGHMRRTLKITSYYIQRSDRT